jgi:hypothetical protein
LSSASEGDLDEWNWFGSFSSFCISGLGILPGSATKAFTILSEFLELRAGIGDAFIS